MTQEDIKTLLNTESTTAIEDISSSDSEHECCDHDHDHSEHHHETTKEGKAISRNEKKARKLIAKLGLKRITNIQRVTIKRTKNVIFAINQPDVYQIPNSDTYIVFGEARFEDLTSQWQRAAAAQQAYSGMAGGNGAQFPPVHSHDSAALDTNAIGKEASIENSGKESAENEDLGNIDETGLDPKDIETVMKQTNVSRSKAVKALKDSENDIVNAIMALSM